jgi:CRISPR-associated protein Cas2
MWMILMFDLPVMSKTQRRAATSFRNWLLDHGWEMSQFSVYLRWAVGKEQVATAIKHEAQNVPKDGKVHVLTVTDKQFASMEILRCTSLKKRISAQQLELF